MGSTVQSFKHKLHNSNKTLHKSNQTQIPIQGFKHKLNNSNQT